MTEMNDQTIANCLNEHFLKRINRLGLKKRKELFEQIPALRRMKTIKGIELSKYKSSFTGIVLYSGQFTPKRKRTVFMVNGKPNYSLVDFIERLKKFDKDLYNDFLGDFILYSLLNFSKILPSLGELIIHIHGTAIYYFDLHFSPK